MNWIYCSKQLPKPYTQVLAAYKSKKGLNICRAEYCEYVKRWRDIDKTHFLPISFKVYAWADLPIPPEYKDLKKNNNLLG